MASSPLYYLLFLIPYLLVLVRHNSSEIATIRPEGSEEEKETQPSIQTPTIVNFSNADYFERRRLVDDTSLVSNASNNRKILADIFGEPEAGGGESAEERSERLHQINSWLSDRDPPTLVSKSRIRTTSSSSSTNLQPDPSIAPSTQALPLKSGGPFLIPQILVSPVYAPAIGQRHKTTSDTLRVPLKAEESRIIVDDETLQNHHPRGSPEDHPHPINHERTDDLDEPPPYETGPEGPGASKTPPCGHQGRFYCSYKEDYPVKVVTEVTRYYKWPLEKLFRDLRQQVMPKLANDNFGGLVCDSITRVVRPGWARNTNNKWLVVINTDQYQQFVTEVICRNGAAAPCNFIPPCYAATCSQRYNTQKLLVVDPWNPYKGPFLSEFLFPSCCICYVPTNEAETRIKSDLRLKGEL